MIINRAVQKERKAIAMADAFEAAIFAWCGLARKPHDLSAVIEKNGKRKLYLKFMSDGGKRDDEAGRVFQGKLREAGIAFEADRLRSARKIDQRALEAAVGAKWPEYL